MRSEMPITSRMSCSMSNTVMLRSFSRRMSPSNSAVSLAFMPAAGSSNSNNFGSAASARAISSRRCAPYGRLRPIGFLQPSNPTKARCSYARSLAAFLLASYPAISRSMETNRF